MKKFFITLMCIIMVVCFMPTVAFAEGGETPETGYGGNDLPEKPIISGDTITVTPGNVQYTLDGAYGSIDDKTIILTEGTYDRLELGRATKYTGSNTEYYIGGVAGGNKKTYEEFVAIKNSGKWSESAYYVRNMNNVTIKAADGADVTVAGITGTSGHVYGESYDYVLDKAYKSGSAYYLTQNWHNITIEGITFTAPANIASSLGTTVIDGVTFRKCTFNIGKIASGNQALRYYNENNDGNVRNLTVENCSFNTCFQGVYTQKINGVTVMNSYFDTTGHNAIAVQSGDKAVNHGAVIITGNTFNNIGDRIIRFGDVGADTQITIKNNTATNSGDDSGQVIKAQSLNEGITYDICKNSWGEGKKVANTEFTDCPAVAEVGNVPFTTLEAAIAAAKDGDAVTLLGDVTEGDGVVVQSGKNITIDFAGHTYTVTKKLAGSSGTETQCFQLLKDATVVMKNGQIVANNSGIKMMIQNYSNLTLENMNIDATTGNNDVDYVVSNNCGNVTIKGSTSIKAKDGKHAFDLYYWPSNGYTEGVNVTVDTTGTIDGIIEYGSDNSTNAAEVMHDKCRLEIKNGTFNGSIVPHNCNDKPNIVVYGGTFTPPVNDKYLAPGFVQDSKGNVYKPYYGGSIPTDSLRTARTEAIKAVTDYINPADYEEAQQAEIKTIVDNAKKDIEAAKTADEIKAIEAAAKAELDKLETAEEMSLIRAIGETKFVARSKAVTLKNGKKAIKITWYDKNGKEVKFDGVEIFRSTKRYSGYGKEPIYVSKSGVYYNTAIEAGTKYYYKVRGYVLVNGEKVYTDYSTKAWRTA